MRFSAMLADEYIRIDISLSTVIRVQRINLNKKNLTSTLVFQMGFRYGLKEHRISAQHKALKHCAACYGETVLIMSTSNK